jgi:hypothetical protein
MGNNQQRTSLIEPQSYPPFVLFTLCRSSSNDKAFGSKNTVAPRSNVTRCFLAFCRALTGSPLKVELATTAHLIVRCRRGDGEIIESLWCRDEGWRTPVGLSPETAPSVKSKSAAISVSYPNLSRTLSITKRCRGWQPISLTTRSLSRWARDDTGISPPSTDTSFPPSRSNAASNEVEMCCGPLCP